MIHSLVVAVFVVVSTQSQAATLKITGMFSSMRFGTEDVAGVEVFVTYSEKGYFAQIQCAEGTISRPILVPVQVTGTIVEFVVPSDSAKNSYSCPSGKFKGEVSGKGMLGHFEGSSWPGFLKRRASYWQ